MTEISQERSRHCRKWVLNKMGKGAATTEEDCKVSQVLVFEPRVRSAFALRKEDCDHKQDSRPGERANCKGYEIYSRVFIEVLKIAHLL